MASISTASHRPVVIKPRKKKAHVLSNAEKQARFRAKRDARLRELEDLAGLRNQIVPQPVTKLRNLPTDTDDLDDVLTRLRRRGEQLAADYARLAVVPGLSAAQLSTILSRFDEWKKLVKAARS